MIYDTNMIFRLVQASPILSVIESINTRSSTQKGQSKMDNPEKVQQDEEKHNMCCTSQCANEQK